MRPGTLPCRSQRGAPSFSRMEIAMPFSNAAGSPSFSVASAATLWAAWARMFGDALRVLITARTFPQRSSERNVPSRSAVDRLAGAGQRQMFPESARAAPRATLSGAYLLRERD